MVSGDISFFPSLRYFRETKSNEYLSNFIRRKKSIRSMNTLPLTSMRSYTFCPYALLDQLTFLVVVFPYFPLDISGNGSKRNFIRARIYPMSKPKMLYPVMIFGSSSRITLAISLINSTSSAQPIHLTPSNWTPSPIYTMYLTKVFPKYSLHTMLTISIRSHLLYDFGIPAPLLDTVSMSMQAIFGCVTVVSSGNACNLLTWTQRYPSFSLHLSASNQPTKGNW